MNNSGEEQPHLKKITFNFNYCKNNVSTEEMLNYINDIYKILFQQQELIGELNDKIDILRSDFEKK